MRFIFFAFFFLTPMAVRAQAIQDVHEVARSTETRVQPISLCAAHGADHVVSRTSSGPLSGAWAVEVFNTATATSTVNCGTDVSVSTNVYSVWYGREVPAGVGVYWAVTTKQTLRCMTQNSGGCTQVTITQLK